MKRLPLSVLRKLKNRRKRNHIKAGTAGVLAIILLAFLVAGCAAGPEAVKPTPSMIPENLPLYVSILPEENRELLVGILAGQIEESQLDQFIERTERIYSGINSDGLFHLVAEGEYPEGLLRFSFFFDNKIKKAKSDFRYWQLENGLEIGFSKTGFLLVSNENIESMFALDDRITGGGVQAPLIEKLKAGDITLYGTSFPELDGVASIIPDDLLKEWQLLLIKREEEYSGQLILELKDDRSARVLGTTIKLLTLTGRLEEESGALFGSILTEGMTLDGNRIIFSGFTFSSEDMIGITDSFFRRE
ncbi:MAG: hypothetical protein JEY99_13715 [Spirochaetales bacterium]|nr:hypothetical protein [Spirochaetales bacterium]